MEEANVLGHSYFHLIFSKPTTTLMVTRQGITVCSCSLRQLAAKRPADLVAVMEERIRCGSTKHTGRRSVAVAEEIRSNVTALEILHANSQVSHYVTLSFGVASTIPSNETSSNASWCC